MFSAIPYHQEVVPPALSSLIPAIAPANGIWWPPWPWPAVAAGADGLMIEVHPAPIPPQGRCSVPHLEHFQDLMKQVAPVAAAWARPTTGRKKLEAVRSCG